MQAGTLVLVDLTWSAGLLALYGHETSLSGSAPLALEIVFALLYTLLGGFLFAAFCFKVCIKTCVDCIQTHVECIQTYTEYNVCKVCMCVTSYVFTHVVEHEADVVMLMCGSCSHPQNV